MKRINNIFKSLLYPLMAIVMGLVIGGIVIMTTGNNPITGIWGLLKGGYLTGYSLASTFTRATPIIFCGVSAALAWGSGYSSMGAQGQMIIGAITAAIVAPILPGPDWLVVILTLICSMIAGALFSLMSAFVSARFNAYLLVITLMFNYVANYFASYLTNYVFLDPYALDKLAIQTQKIEGSILPRIIPKYTTHLGFIISIAVVLLAHFLVKKTSFGYKARMGGLNPHFAEYGGIESRKTMYKVLMISGAVAGLGGACEVLGTKFRYVDEMITSPGYSWSGITASLMSNYNMIGTLFGSIFLAGITVGGSVIELTMNIPSEITQVIQGVISMLITAKIAVDWNKLNRKKARAE